MTGGKAEFYCNRLHGPACLTRTAQVQIRAQAPTITGESQHPSDPRVASLRRSVSVSISTSAAVAIPNFSIAGSNERVKAASTAYPAELAPATSRAAA